MALHVAWRNARATTLAFIASLETRALLRLADKALRTVSEVNEALSHTRGVGSAKSPGLEETEKALRRLEERGLAEEVDGRWRQTPAGATEDNRLESVFDSSGGYGDYGF